MAKAILERMNQHYQIPTRLCIVGSGPQDEELRDYFQGTPTIFLGRMDGLELSQAFASGDIFVMPSDSETLGFVVLESMASGVPCVAAKAGGLIDLIQDGSTGFLVPPGDIDAFCQSIQKLHQTPDLYQSMLQAGRLETEEWSWEASMEQVRSIIYPLALQNFSNRWEQRIFRLFSRRRASQAAE